MVASREKKKQETQEKIAHFVKSAGKMTLVNTSQKETLELNSRLELNAESLIIILS